MSLVGGLVGINVSIIYFGVLSDQQRTQNFTEDRIQLFMTHNLSHNQPAHVDVAVLRKEEDVRGRHIKYPSLQVRATVGDTVPTVAAGP
jgi:hypothetical protein